MRFAVLAALVLCLAEYATCYSLKANYSGNYFFNQFSFWNAPDPTHGYVYYASQSEANAWGYTYVSGGVVYIHSDHTSVSSGSGRGSVRLGSTATYNQNSLFVFDVIHMPFGCGTWPAIWLCGPNWPNEGEIDILEGVNQNNKNQMTLHTSAGCNMNTGRSQTGTTDSDDCNANDNGNAGCGVTDTRTSSYGQGFNNGGGGVWAVQWTSTAINIWFFPRNSIPADINKGNPNPAGWGTPAANFPLGGNCPSSHFANMQIVLDNTFCGDWAGAVFNQDGCPGSCQSYVQNNPGDFTESYWAINYFKVYQ